MRSVGELASLLAAGIVPNLAYLALGLWAMRGVGPRARGAERLAIAYVFGAGIASLAILLLRAADVPIPLPALALVAAAGIPAWRSGAADPAPAASAPSWAGAVDLATGAVALLLFAAALGPETVWDGFEYHLPLARAWSDAPLAAVPGMIDAELRAGIDLLFIPAVASGQPDAAAAVSACFAASLAGLIRAEAGRRASPGAGAWAGLFTLLVPFTLDLAPTTYVDLGVGATGFLALSFADRWNRHGDPRDLTLAAIFLGFAANAKLHAAILCPAALALVWFGGRRPATAALARCASWTALLAAPWIVKATLTTGNPFFPFLCEWFGYGPTRPETLAAKRGDVYHYVRVDRTPQGLLWYLTSIPFGRAYHIGGLLGPLPLALAPFAALRPSRPTGALLLTLLVLFALQFAAMPALRFGAPLWPFVAVAAAVGGARLAHSGPAAAATLGGVLVTLAGLAPFCAFSVDGAPAALDLVRRVAALRDPAAHERALFPDQDALREVVARGEGVVAIPKGAVSWMPQPVYNLHWSRNGELFFDPPPGHARTPPDVARAILDARGVRSVALDVTTPLPRDGTLRHPTVDAWIRAGRASLRPDPAPPAARRNRVWVLVDLH